MALYFECRINGILSAELMKTKCFLGDFSHWAIDSVSMLIIGPFLVL